MELDINEGQGSMRELFTACPITPKCARELGAQMGASIHAELCKLTPEQIAAGKKASLEVLTKYLADRQQS